MAYTKPAKRKAPYLYPSKQIPRQKPVVTKSYSERHIRRLKHTARGKEPSAFPGVIRGSLKYKDGTPGLFVKSVKGMKGTNYVEKGYQRAISEFLSARE